ncbi:trypsin-like serine protease [Lentzea sp. NPDC059081]|uniref:trypsin-like serine protease n=1 Tax=Lentzea sp. NPDC059081 TaxID=3346719 RepID=UPI00368B54F7
MLEDEQRPGWSQWGLLAAHCVTNLPTGISQARAWMFGERLNGSPVWVPVEKKAYQVRAGSLDRTQVPPVQIDQVVVYPGWEWIPGGEAPVEAKEAGDAALFRLATPVKVRGAIVATTEPKPGAKVSLVGFGRTSNGSAATPTTAYTLRTTVLQKQACASADVSVNDVCTDNPRRGNGPGAGAGACSGDSGGPVIKEQPGRDEVTGVISRGANVDCGESPDVSTSVASIAPWIKSVLNDEIAYGLPLTAAQGGPIPHPSIKFSTTAPMQRSDRPRVG